MQRATAPRPWSGPPDAPSSAAAGHGPPARDDEHVARLDQAALPTVGRLARDGAIVLCTYAEFGPPPPPGDGSWRSLLGDVPVATVEPAIDRAAFGADVFDDAPQPGALARFCTRLKSGHAAFEGLSGDALGALPQTTRRGIASLRRYRELAARVQGDHLGDLFHLWTGELADCRWWLTFDPSVEDFLGSRVRPFVAEPLRCEPVGPDRLLQVLGVAARDAAPRHDTVVAFRGPSTPPRA